MHRDLKLDNILVDEHERVRVADFGLARADGMMTITASDVMLGTPVCMAPEQVAASHEAGPPADVWALGVISTRH